jgi:radical SAM protein with 4Fe4S-binding SPASM domain
VSCGNIFKESLIDIWKNNTLLKMLRDDNYLSEKCKRCVFKNSCRGGCRAFSYIKYGDITHVDPFCWI